MSFANSPKKTCRPHSGNLDNRHVEIVCAASARVNVSVLYQFVDTAMRPWPTSIAPRRGFSRSGSAWLGRSQKVGLPSCCGGSYQRFKAIDSRERGSLVAAPSNRRRKWMPRRSTLLCSPSCRCSVPSPLGRGIETFLARCFLPSVQSRCSAQPIGSGADMDQSSPQTRGGFPPVRSLVR